MAFVRIMRLLFKLLFAALRGLVWLIRLLMRPVAPLLDLVGTALHLSADGATRARERRAQKLADEMLAELALFFQSRGRQGKVRHFTWQYPLLCTADELWAPLDLSSRPFGTSTNDIRDDDVLKSLEDRCHTSIRIDKLATGKLCLVARLAGSAFPEAYSINNVAIAPDAPPLTVPFGVNEEGDLELHDLADLVHLLVAGATGGGKSTLFHTIITTIINRNTAHEVEINLIDLKQVMGMYRPLQGTGGGGIVGVIATEPEAAIDILDRTFREINRRNALLAQVRAVDLADMERITGQRMKRIVLLVDEFAVLVLNKEKIGRQSIGSIATNLMVRIASLGRSAGVTIVIATQVMAKEVLSTTIRANFENKICFSTADWRQSQMVIESSRADGIPRGRAVMRVKGALTMVQTPLISPRQVRIEIDRIAEFGPAGAWGEDLERQRFCREATLLVTMACEKLGGEFVRVKLLALEGVKGVITQERFNDMAARLEHDGVLEPGGPRKPRRVTRAFFGNVGLLEVLYGTAGPAPAQTVTQTVADGHDIQLEKKPLRLARPDAEKPYGLQEGDTVYGLPHEADMPTISHDDESPTAADAHTPADAADDTPPAPFTQFLRSLDDTIPPAPPKKPRKPRKKGGTSQEEA